MSQLIKIRIRNAEKLEFALCSDAKENDYVSLKEVNQIDLSELERQISDEKNKMIDARLKTLLEKERGNIINEFKAGKEYSDLRKELSDAKESLAKEKANSQAAIANFMQTDEYQTLVKSEADLRRRLDLKNQELESIRLKAKDEFRQSEEFVGLQNKVQSLQIENAKLRETSEKDLQIKTLELGNKHAEEIQKKDAEIELLRRERSANVKILGEGLENWIRNQYDVNLGNIEDCKLEKTTKTVEGTKADFLFTVFAKDEVLGSVTIEAKTQLDSDKTKTLNASHYAKLAKDSKNNGSDFSLLVTELEPEDAFVVKKIHEHENMYACRPVILISFLTLIRAIYKRRESLLAEKGVINFKEKQAILDDFEALKNELIEKHANKITEELNKIVDYAGRIEKLAGQVSDEAKKIIDRHTRQMVNKIERYHIKKIAKEADRLESDS